MKRKWLSKLRKSKKIPQWRAAEFAGVKLSQYASLERGEGSAVIDAALAVRLAKIFGVDVEYIEEWERVTPITSQARTKLNPNPPTKDTRRIICWWTEDGETPAEIGGLLCRPPEQVAEILAACRVNGEYDRYCRERRLHRDTLSR